MRAPTVAVGVLTVQLEGTLVETVALTGRVLTIGRLPDNGLVLQHPSVSRHHAEVHVEPGGTVITDVGSSSGTVVGGTRLLPNQPALLEAGVDVQIGPYVLTYEAATPLQLSPPPPTGAPSSPPYGVPSVYTPPRPAAEEPLPDVRPRPTFPRPLPAAAPSRYLQHLPAIFQENEFLGRMLLIFEALWEPLEQRQDHIALYYDPRTAPAGYLSWLASWLHLDLNPHWPEERRRLLLSEAMELYRWRGTAYGLTRMIEVCTGLTPSITDDAAQPFTFRIAVRLPPGSDVRPEFIEELVRTHKPAHVGYSLEISP